MADAVLSQLQELDRLSFYGLAQWLREADKLLERADHALTSKAPRPEDSAIAEKKDELVDAIARLRRAMGARLENPSLTKREKPLAQDFLNEQLAKQRRTAKTDARAAKAVEKLTELLAGVDKAPFANESREVKDIEASMKQLETEWKEVSPLYEKWQAGRHNFKSNADLQAFRRRYEDCRKGRDAATEKLQKALYVQRTAQDAKSRWENDGPPAGWSAVAKKAPAAPAQRSGFRASAAPSRPAAPKANRWGSAMVSFAQRLRAEVSAQVRGEVQQEQAADTVDDEALEKEEEAAACEQKPQVIRAKAPPPNLDERPIPPPVPVMPKRPPQLPPCAPPSSHVTAGLAPGRAGAAATKQQSRSAQPSLHPEEVDAEDDMEAEEEPETSGKAAPVSAKKKARGKKKKAGGVKGLQQEDAGDDDVDDLPMPPRQENKQPARAAAWAASAERALSGSLLQELWHRSAWSLPESDAEADAALTALSERLPLTNPLGLRLPTDWKGFVGQPIDGGPRRTSKRGTPEWVHRLQRNVPLFLAHYISIVFFMTLLHASSHFGLLLWVAAAQVALILAPPDLPQIRMPIRVVVLQAVHLVLWFSFIRSLWLMHIFIKLLVVALVAVHAYVVADSA